MPPLGVNAESRGEYRRYVTVVSLPKSDIMMHVPMPDIVNAHATPRHVLFLVMRLF